MKDKSQRQGDKLMVIVMFTLAVSAMSALMFVIVIPEISAEFNLTFAQVSWLSSAYALIYAVGTITYGKLADKYKLKNLLTFGLLFFAAGSLVGLVSQTFLMALVGRCLQAVGAAAVPAGPGLGPEGAQPRPRPARPSPPARRRASPRRSPGRRAGSARRGSWGGRRS
jgi:MFS transporter, DHA2 family, metal-tetracycline-proton antiporter